MLRCFFCPMSIHRTTRWNTVLLHHTRSSLMCPVSEHRTAQADEILIQALHTSPPLLLVTLYVRKSVRWKKKHRWGLFPVTDGTSGAQTAFAHLNPAGNQFKVCRSYRRTSFTDCYTLAHMHGHAHVTAQHCQLLRRHIRSEVINHERVRAVGLV